MDKKDLNFEGFLVDVNPAYHETVTQINNLLLENGCAVKMELAKRGYLVSYSDKNKCDVRTNNLICQYMFDIT